MSELTVFQNGKQTVIEFTGNPVLSDVLEQNGFTAPRPCGGLGKCGKCAVKVSGNISAPSKEELARNVRLACKTVLFGDSCVVLSDKAEMTIQTEGIARIDKLAPMEGNLGAAVDIGTTTVVLKLFDLKTGNALSAASMMNPQTSAAADVMGRIDAAMHGKLEVLKNDIQQALAKLCEEACENAGVSSGAVDVFSISGNTTMLYLLCGINPTSLSRAPFVADTLFDTYTQILERPAYLPPCMNAFVGADITCAVLACEMCSKDEVSLLCDIGTNGELALWKDGVLYVTSTAAGPAFEGAGISCGCGSIPGAIDKVWIEDNEVKVHTIGDVPAVGVCGSGLMDAVSAFLKIETVDETGATEDDELVLTENVALIPKDIRAVQLAKAAISAGIQTLAENAGIELSEIESVYIAGGFGSHLNIQSAADIGLIPGELADKVKIIGNAALSGTEMLLLNRDNIVAAREIAKVSTHVNLGGNPKFNEYYMDNMFF